ncbi:transcription factor tau 60 kDa subunit [Monosporozyma unispora]|nr:hypothetical protein C6P44_000564 [Kazachstania unispora]
MKLLKDLIVSRMELQQWDDVITWGEDGSLFFGSIPEVTIGQPLYSQDIKKSSKGLFHLKNIDLPIIENKLEFEDSRNNVMLNSQPQSYIRICKPCPSNGQLVAALTNNGNIIIYYKQKPILNLDQSGRSLEERVYHSFSWSPEGTCLAVGNEANEVVLFSIDIKAESFICKNIKLDDGENWIIKLAWNADGFVASSANNTVYYIHNFNEENIKPIITLPSSRFKVTDILAIEKYIMIATCGKLYKIDTENHNTVSTPTDFTLEYHLVPLFKSSEVILFSSKNSHLIKLSDNEITFYPDEIISPHLEKKFLKWNEYENPSNKYETNLYIYGVALSPDGYSVAIAYTIQRISFKYTIVSENKFNVMFIPLYKDWELSTKASGLEWFQTYNIYEKSLPIVAEDDDSVGLNSALDTNLDFDEYLMNIMEDKSITKRCFLNIIEPDSLSLDLFRALVFKYAEAHKDRIEHPVDKLCVESLSEILGVSSLFDKKSNDTICVKGEFIEQVFNIFDNADPQIIESNEGNKWRRCSLTLLPLLTTNTKVCPVSNQRIIDIQKDFLNEYGWFSKTLLEFFNDKSPYTSGKLDIST